MPTEAPQFGPCCSCGQEGPTIRNLYTMPFRGPSPGKGWGCLTCDLPQDGAICVVCDACHDAKREPTHVVVGYPTDKLRMPLADLERYPFDHDPSKHPEEREGQEAREGYDWWEW